MFPRSNTFHVFIFVSQMKPYNLQVKFTWFFSPQGELLIIHFLFEKLRFIKGMTKAHSTKSKIQVVLQCDQ